MAIQDEFKARLERDVARFMNHATQSGMDVGALDGDIVLHIHKGQLIDVNFQPYPIVADADPPARETWQETSDRLKQKKSRTDD
jgi:hypothetical protein